MSNIALYRQFRPKKFADLMGQEYVSTILKNQIKNDRVGHAYLFCGSRGTGKTSTAKIFSRAINCLKNKDGEPCNECEICKGIMNESITDVIEMDAASNNGVDNIRDIREEVVYLPTQTKYKVYIIDEVHMLSTGAFNALLKTLEEPPKDVVFILATTEPHKLPVTILSRLQKFEFGKIKKEDINIYLKKVINEINVEVEDNALEYISVLADGGMRDALSILERCISDVKNNISCEDVKSILGITDNIYIFELLENILNNDGAKAIKNIVDIEKNGRDLRNYLLKTVEVLIDIIIYKKAGEIQNYSKEEIERIEKISKIADESLLLSFVSNLSELDTAFRQSTNPSIIFKSKILDLSTRNKQLDYTDVLKRIEYLEEKLKEGNINVVLENQPKTKENKDHEKEDFENSIILNQKEENREIKKEQYKDNILDWPQIKKKISESGKMRLFASLVQVDANKIDDETIGLICNSEYIKKLLNEEENKKTIINAIKDVMGKEYAIKFIEEKVESGPGHSKIEKMFMERNVNFIVED